MKSLANAKEARIYASYETGKKVVRDELSVDLPNADALINGLFYTKNAIDCFYFIVVFLSINDIYYRCN